MDKRFWICGLVVAVAAMLLGFVVHGVLLRADYLAVAHLYRTPEEANANLGWIVLAYGLVGYAMTWFFRQQPARDIAHGLRFGLMAALLSYVPWHLLSYAGEPLPLSLMLKQVALDVAAMLLLGVLLAWLQPRRLVL